MTNKCVVLLQMLTNVDKHPLQSSRFSYFNHSVCEPHVSSSPPPALHCWAEALFGNPKVSAKTGDGVSSAIDVVIEMDVAS